MNYRFIKTQAELQELCAQLSPNFVALDTEFVRTRTLYANLGLLQLAQDEQLYLIDPLAVGDLQSLWQALESRPCLLHSFGEDLEIIKNHKGNLTGRWFDTQIACAFLGYGNSLGYAAMVEKLLGVTLDKGEARTDWLARPLRQQQLDYAIKDVAYLEACYVKLEASLNEQGLYTYFVDECQSMVGRRDIEVVPEQLYLDFKNVNKLSRRSVTLLQKLASWRYKVACERNFALNFVVKANHLLEVAKRFPSNQSQLNQAGMTEQEIRVHGRAILAMVKDVRELDDSQMLNRVKPIIEYPAYKTEFKQVKQKINDAAARNNLPVELIASKRVIHQYLSWLWKLSDEERQCADKPLLLSGWRSEIIEGLTQ